MLIGEVYFTAVKRSRDDEDRSLSGSNGRVEKRKCKTVLALPHTFNMHLRKLLRKREIMEASERACVCGVVTVVSIAAGCSRKK